MRKGMKYLQAYVPEELYTRLDDIRWSKRITMAELFRRILFDYVNMQQDVFDENNDREESD